MSLMDPHQISIARKIMRKVYSDMGFEVIESGALKKQPYVDVQAKDAKIDEDFYHKGDDE